nr:uncharacterized protein LOC106687555 [Halyomorpha halys]
MPKLFLFTGLESQLTKTFLRSYRQGRGSDVHHGDRHFRHMLAALPRLLHLRLPQPLGHLQHLHPSPLPRLLLAGHVQRHGQPHNLLLDEQQVQSILQAGDMLLWLYQAPEHAERASEPPGQHGVHPSVEILPLSEVSRLASDMSSCSSSTVHVEAVCLRFDQYPKRKYSKQYLESRYN